MLKNFLFLALVCALVGCQKDSVQINNNESAPSYKKAGSNDYQNLPQEVRDIIANGGAGHNISCEISNDKKAAVNSGFFGGASALGAYAYPYSLGMSPIKLFASSLPCQPSIPYFIFSNLESEGDGKGSTYSANFHLVLNPSYFNSVKIVDIEWELNGQNILDPNQIFTLNDLQIGESNSVSCRVFSTENNITVYSQEMSFDFEILIDIDSGAVIEFASGATYACTNTGIFPIVAP